MATATYQRKIKPRTLNNEKNYILFIESMEKKSGKKIAEVIYRNGVIMVSKWKD